MLKGMTRREWMGGAFAAQLGRKVRVGVIGFEGHVNQLTEALPQLPDVELAAYASPEPSRDAAFARATHYTDRRKMLDREQLDIAVVANDDGARAGGILDCVERKVHVYAEKPLARTKDDYLRVKRAVTNSGIRLGMMMNLRYEPQFVALRDVARSGALGEVAQMQGQKSYRPGITTAWRNRAETYSGTIPWVGIHTVDLMLFASGRRFVEAAAFQTRIGWPELGPRDNAVGVLFRMDNGGVAVLNLDYLRPDTAPTHEDDRLRIAGTKGVAEYQAATGVRVLGAPAPELKPRRSIFADYVAAVLGQPSTALTHAEIWAANEAVLAAREAAETGRVVKIG